MAVKPERLDKLLALTGMSRADAKKCVAAGRVSVNGVPARDPGMKALPEEVCVSGEPIAAEREIWIMMNKPAGVITATEDYKLPTVVSLLPEKYAKRKIGPVGRLDRDVTGLVFLTTDGQTAHRLISPKHKAEKRYRAVCEGRPTEETVRLFASGMDLGDFIAAPAKLEILEPGEETSVADAILTEGKFHQVKRMFAAAGHPLVSLKRLSIGGVELDPALEEGAWRHLTPEEIHVLKTQAGTAED